LTVLKTAQTGAGMHYSSVTQLKPICAGCRAPITGTVFRCRGLAVCEQCIDGHLLYFQLIIEARRARGAVFFHPGMTAERYGKCRKKMGI